MEAWAPGHRPPAKLVEFLEKSRIAREAARSRRPLPPGYSGPELPAHLSRRVLAITGPSASSSSGA
eukprot:5802817-Pleurochrysis_carterae.AAC.1